MRSVIKIDWQGDMQFDGIINGHKVVLDAAESAGGHNAGFRPKPLLMVALAGCTGMDVISLLKKMRVEVSAFEVMVEGDLKEEHPQKFEKIKIIYKLTGDDIDADKVKKAVNLSIDRYCGVYATLKDSVEISHEIVIE